MDVITISSGEEDNTVPNVTEKVKRTFFEKFLETCKLFLKKEDVSLITTKIKKIHDNTAQVYTSSVEFKLLLKRKAKDISNDPKNIYVHVKEVADELKLRKVKKKLAENDAGVKNGHLPSVAGTSAADTTPLKEGLSELERRHVRKLTKVMRLLHNKIQVLETKEVDFDEDNDSAYMRLQRYRERFCKVREKLSKYNPEISLRKQKVSFPAHTHSELFRRLEKIVNKTKQFPDYHDVLKTVIECKLSSNAEENQSIASHAFEVIGNELQKRRQYEDWVSMSSFLGSGHDPALDSPELEEKLKTNEEEGKSKIASIINKFVERETESKLEPKEVGEEEAEMSAGEGSGQEEEEEIKNVEEDAAEEDNADEEDTGMPDDVGSTGSEPEDEGEENDDILVEERCISTGNSTASPQVDRLLRPVSPPVWEEYFSPSHENSECERVANVPSTRQGMLHVKRSLPFVLGNSSSPKKIKSGTSSTVTCSSLVGSTVLDIDTPTTVLLD